MPYYPYRGTRRPRRGKVFFVLAFTFLALIAATVIFFAAQEYIVFSADGFRFELPFGKTPTEPATEPPTESVDLEIIESTTAPATEPPRTTVPATEPPFVKPLTAARLVTIDAFENGSGDLAPALIVKDIDGVWHMPPQGGAQTLVTLAEHSGTAVFSAMRDAFGPRVTRSDAVTTTGGVTWLDFNNISWYNPYTGAGNLLSAVQAGAQAGLGELVFTNLQFPTRGRLEYITYGEGDTPEARIAAITALVEPLRGYLDDEGSAMYLSVVLTPACAELFTDGDAGQDLLALAALCDILYVQTTDPNFDVNPLLDYISTTDCRIGLWLTGQGSAHSAADSSFERRLDFILAD